MAAENDDIKEYSSSREVNSIRFVIDRVAKRLRRVLMSAGAQVSNIGVSRHIFHRCTCRSTASNIASIDDQRPELQATSNKK